MITRIHPAIPVHVMGKGNALAHFLIDGGIETDLQWVVFLDSDGSCWTVANPGIRGRWNVTAGRTPKPADPFP